MRIARMAFAAVLACLLFFAAPARAQSAAELEADDEWVTGNLTFLAYHELGHMLLDQVLQVNQFSNRLAAEQAADDIATWLLSPDPGDTVEGEEIIAALEGWLMAADTRGQTGPWDNEHYPDDETRASRIACLLIGSDTRRPNAFADLQPIAALHFDVSTCRQAYIDLDEAMVADFGDAVQIKANPVARVQVVYEQAAPALQDARDFLIRTNVLEDLRADLVASIGVPINLVLRGAACGESSPGFKYVPTRREIIACYEEVDWFLFGDSEAGEPAAQRQPLSAGQLGARPRRIAPRPNLVATPPPPQPRQPR